MAEKTTTEKPVKDDKTLEIDLGGVEKDVTIFTDKEQIVELDKQDTTNTAILKEQNSAPSHNSNNFREQFAMYNGDLYANINNNWTKLSLSELVGGVVGTNLITNDTHINENSPSTNYVSSITLSVGDRPTFTLETQSLLFANLENLDGTTITSATLYFYVESYSEWTTKNVLIGKILNSWDDATTTWGNAPSFSTADGILINLANTDTGWQSVEITTIVQEWLDRTINNFGIVLKDSGSGGSGNNETMVITSSNATSNKPYIEIV